MANKKSFEEIINGGATSASFSSSNTNQKKSFDEVVDEANKHSFEYIINNAESVNPDYDSRVKLQGSTSNGDSINNPLDLFDYMVEKSGQSMVKWGQNGIDEGINVANNPLTAISSIPETVGGLLKYVPGLRGNQIIENGIESASKAVENVKPTIQQIDDKIGLDAIGEATGLYDMDEVKQNFDTSMQKQYDDMLHYDEENMAQWQKELGNVASAIGSTVPSAALSLVTGNPTVGLASMGVSAAGGATEQALAEGADMDDALAYGIASGALEVATENLFGGIPLLGDGWLDDVGKPWLEKTFKSKAMQEVIKYVQKSFIGEGFEEYVSGVAGEYLTGMYKEYDGDKEGFERFIEANKDALYDALLGGISGLVLGSGQGINNITSGIGADNSSASIQNQNVGQTTQTVQTPINEADLVQSPIVQEANLSDQTIIPEVQEAVAPEQVTNTVPAEEISARRADGTVKTVEEMAQEQIQANANLQAAETVEQMAHEQEASNNQSSIIVEGLASSDPIIKMESQRINSENIQQSAKSAGFTNEQAINDIVEVANKLGVTVEFTDGLIENIGIGSYNNNKIVISTQADSMNQVFVHELTHLAESSGEYQNLRNVLFNLAEADGINMQAELESTIRAYSEAKGRMFSEEEGLNELTAKLAQEYLFKEENINKIVESDLSLGQKIMNWIKDLRVRLFGTSQEKALQRAENLYKKAINDVQNQTLEDNNSQYLIAKTLTGEDVVVFEETDPNFNNLMWEGKDGFKRAKKNIKDYINNKVKIRIDSDGNIVNFNKTSVGEYLFSKTSDRLKKMGNHFFRDKKIITTNLGEVIGIAKNGKLSPNYKGVHNNNPKIGANGFYHYDTIFAIPVLDGNNNVSSYNVYTADLVLDNNADGNVYFYDLVKQKKSPLQIDITSMGLNGKPSGNSGLYTNTISNSNENVNENFENVSDSSDNDVSEYDLSANAKLNSFDADNLDFQRRLRNTFMFNEKTNPTSFYNLTDSVLKSEFDSTGKISQKTRNEIFREGLKNIQENTDVSYKNNPDFISMLQNETNKAINSYIEKITKEKSLLKYAEENNIKITETKKRSTVGFLENVDVKDIPNKVIAYNKLKKNLREALISPVENYGGREMNNLIDQATKQILEKGAVDPMTRFRMLNDLTSNAYHIEDTNASDLKAVEDMLQETIYIPRNMANEVSDLSSIRKNKKLKTSTTSGVPIDKYYDQLSRQFPGIFPEDITSSADQLLKIDEVTELLEPVKVMLKENPDYNADMKEYIRDSFDTALEEFRSKVIYNSNKDFYDRVAKKLLNAEEVTNEVVDEASKEVYEDVLKEIMEGGALEIDENQATILTDLAFRMVDRGALSKTAGQNFDAMADGDVEVRSILNEVFEKPMREAKKSYVQNLSSRLNSVYKEVVTDLGIKKGSKESAAVMWFGEGKRPTNSKWNPSRKTTNTQGQKIEFDNYSLSDLKADFPDSWQNIKKASEIYRGAYEEYIDRLNDMLSGIYSEKSLKEQSELRKAEIRQEISTVQQRLDAANKATKTPVIEAKINEYRNQIRSLTLAFNKVDGEVRRNKRVEYRSDYFHHFQDMTASESILNVLQNQSERNISNALSGISENTKPKTKWAGFMQNRGNTRYVEDAVDGFVRYAQAAEYKLAFDPVVAKYRGSIQALIHASDEMGVNNTKAIRWLTNYTNDLAGKTNPIDRMISHSEIGRNAVSAMRKINGRVKGNAIMGNLNSAVSQFYNLPNGVAVLNKFGGAQAQVDLAKGAKDYATYQANRLAGQDVSGSPINESVFLKERFMDDCVSQFDEGILKKPKEASTFLLTVGDQIVAEQLWFSAYNQAVRLKVDDTIAYADDLVARSVAGRGVGEVPLMQKSELVKLIAPFQVETNNAYQTLKQLLRDKDKDSVLGLALMFGVNWLMNQINEQITGNRVGIDMIDAFLDVQENWDSSKNVVTNSFSSLGRLAGEVMSNAPMGAMISQIAFDETQREKFFGEADPTMYGTANIGLSAITKPALQLLNGENVDWQSVVTNFATPFGGKQINRMYKMAEDSGIIPRIDFNTEDLIQVSQKQGAYNDKGNLKYQIDLSDPLNVLKGFAFGTYATKEGKDYTENELSAFSEKKTSMYEALVEQGADPVAAYNGLRSANVSQNLKDSDGKGINNSKAALNRLALEENGIYEEVIDFIENSPLNEENKPIYSASDFGMNNSVVSWDYETYKAFLDSLNQ